MHSLPTDRAGWLVLLAACANLAAHATLLTLIVVNKPTILSMVWKDLVVYHFPAVLILVAAGLCYRGHSLARYMVIAAGLLAATGEVCALDAWAGGPLASVVGHPAVRAGQRWLADTPWSYLIALAALAPAAVGRWQRRQDRPEEANSAA